MRKTLFGMAIAAMVCALAACGNKAKGGEEAVAEAEAEAEAIDSIVTAEVGDTVSPPMFLMDSNGGYELMVYWTSLKKPVKTEDNAEWFDESYASWALQEQFRRNRAQYTNLIIGDRRLKVRYVDEELLDPDGNEPSFGELHSINGIPSLCARYVIDKTAGTDTAATRDDTDYADRVIVTDDYLRTRRQLTVRSHSAWGDGMKKMPADAIKKLEQRYGMKVSRSVMTATIPDDSITWSWGCVQFKGEYKAAPKDRYNPELKAALALDVLTDGTRVFVNEVLNYYEDEREIAWNVDDGGEYIPDLIAAAFEGPQGLELCYVHYAPESTEVGMFYQRGDSLSSRMYITYHAMIDEQPIVWKRDFALMDSLYHADDRSEADAQLVKWAHIYPDYTNEWIWVRAADDKHGAFFIRKDGRLTLIGVENETYRPSACSNRGTTYLMLDGPAGGPGWVREIHIIKDGKEVDTFFSLEAYGEIDECSMTGKQLTKEQGQAFLKSLPEGEEIRAYFQDITK